MPKHMCSLNPEAHDAATCPGAKGEIRAGKIDPITPEGMHSLTLDSWTETLLPRPYPVKRFAVFEIGDTPDGGWDDFYGSFDTLREAKKFCREIDSLEDDGPAWQIIDLQDGEELIVGGSRPWDAPMHRL